MDAEAKKNLRIMSDLLMAMDNHNLTLLLLLDRSSLTIDHCCLLETLQICFGIGGVVLRWNESYLADRHQIRIDCGLLICFPYTIWCPTRV